MLLPLESFQAHTARIRPIRIVSQLVPLQVLLPLQSRSTDVTNKPSLYLVRGQMLLQVLLLRVRAMTLRTAEQYGSIQGSGNVHLAWLWPLGLRWFLLVLPLLLALLSTFSVTVSLHLVIVIIVRLAVVLGLCEELSIITVDDEPIQLVALHCRLPLNRVRTELQELIQLHWHHHVRVVRVTLVLEVLLMCLCLLLL